MFQTKWLSLTYIALLIISVKFIAQLCLCINLNDHYNVTDSEFITCQSFCITLIFWNQKVPTAVTNNRIAIVIVFFLVAKLITVLF